MSLETRANVKIPCKTIDRFHERRPKNYSFVYVLIRPTSLVLKEQFCCILYVLTRLVGLISTKTIEYFFDRHLCNRSMQMRFNNNNNFKQKVLYQGKALTPCGSCKRSQISWCNSLPDMRIRSTHRKRVPGSSLRKPFWMALSGSSSEVENKRIQASKEKKSHRILATLS